MLAEAMAHDLSGNKEQRQTLMFMEILLTRRLRENEGEGWIPRYSYSDR
jgi:hypothetical protein